MSAGQVWAFCINTVLLFSVCYHNFVHGIRGDYTYSGLLSSPGRRNTWCSACLARPTQRMALCVAGFPYRDVALLQAASTTTR